MTWRKFVRLLRRLRSSGRYGGVTATYGNVVLTGQPMPGLAAVEVREFDMRDVEVVGFDMGIRYYGEHNPENKYEVFQEIWGEGFTIVCFGRKPLS